MKIVTKPAGYSGDHYDAHAKKATSDGHLGKSFGSKRADIVAGPSELGGTGVKIGRHMPSTSGKHGSEPKGRIAHDDKSVRGHRAAMVTPKRGGKGENVSLGGNQGKVKPNAPKKISSSTKPAAERYR